MSEYLVETFNALDLGEMEKLYSLRQRRYSSDEERASKEELIDDQLQELEDIRENFWTLTKKQVAIRLSALPDSISFRDRDRLQSINALRDSFDELIADKDVQAEFIEQYQKNILLSKSERLAWKHRFQGTVDAWQLKQVRKSIQFMKRRHRLLYNQDEEWFRSLLTAESKEKFDKEGSDESSGVSIWWIFWAIFILIRILSS